ncbi:MAG TPA: Crp/Fnr family transcriptional regulator [Bryobacteraceae bacterium]|jgi:CRP/FNR family transcriptional regulator
MAFASSHLTGVLRKTALFSALSQSEMEALANRTVVRSCDSGEVLFSEGEPCAGLYVIASGRVRIFKTSSSGREQILAVEGPGGSIAELPVFDGGGYPASGAALEPSQLLFISRADFRALCLEHPEIALKVLQVVGARLRKLVGIIEELSFATVRHRLISWILRRVRTEGAAFSLGATHQELASQIGTVRELVSRNLTRLQAQGFITIEAGELTVLDADGLEAEIASVV